MNYILDNTDKMINFIPVFALAAVIICALLMRVRNKVFFAFALPALLLALFLSYRVVEDLLLIRGEIILFAACYAFLIIAIAAAALTLAVQVVSNLIKKRFFYNKGNFITLIKVFIYTVIVFCIGGFTVFFYCRHAFTKIRLPTAAS